MELLSLLLTSTILLCLVNIAARIFRTWQYRKKVNAIPGPRSIPFFGISIEASRIKMEDRVPWLMNLNYSYKNGIFRTWIANQAAVHLRKPKHLEAILSSTVQIEKSTVYDSIRCWLGEGLLTSTGAKWHSDRKMITPSFHFGVLEEFSKIMYEKAEIFNECLEKEIRENPGKPVDIFAFSVRCTMDVITETAMGMDLNCQREVDNAYGKAVHRFSLITLQRIFKPWMKWDWFFYKTATGKELLETLETMHNYSTSVIRKKQEERRIEKNYNTDDVDDDDMAYGMKKRKAFLDLLLDASENEKTPLSEQELREQVDTFMFAGHDTTATAIAWGIFLIGHHPEIQQKIHNELDDICGGPDNLLSMKTLHNLKYLEMVMKEILRLYPSAPSISRRLVEDFELDGMIIPKSTNVVVGILMLHHDPETWPDPEKFDPERFSLERSKTRHPYAYLPFSAGPRNCIGQKFAMLEMKIVLATILRKWRFKSVRSIKDTKMVMAFILRPHDGIPVHVLPR